MGAGEPSDHTCAAARELGRVLAERGWIVLTGGRPVGIMAAAVAGAKQVPGSITLGILPGAAGGESPDLDLAVFTGMGDARNAINVLTSDVVVACGIEGPGTLSEIALAFKASKPVVLLDLSDSARTFFRGIPRARWLEADSPEQVAGLIESQLMIPRGPPWPEG
jgi:uncharacterized protein (TIGR00725 family)